MKVTPETFVQDYLLRHKLKWARQTLHQAKHRAKKFGRPFSITLADIDTPDFCPVSRIQLSYYNTKVAYNSPALDRKDPALGYIPGNVWTISCWINSIKGRRTLLEFEPEMLEIALKVHRMQTSPVSNTIADKATQKLINELNAELAGPGVKSSR